MKFANFNIGYLVNVIRHMSDQRSRIISFEFFLTFAHVFFFFLNFPKKTKLIAFNGIFKL